MATGLEIEEFPVHKAESLTKPNSILVYGPPGKGKSVFAASISAVPGFERTVILDIEGSSVAVGPHYPNVDVVKVPTAKLFIKYVEGLLSGKFVEPKSGLPYQCVIIDTFDKAFDRQLEVFAASPEAMQNGKENSFYKWGAIKTWTSKVADALHQADFLTIFVMHEDRDKDENTGKVTTTVLLAGKSQMSFPSVSDMNIYFNMQPVLDEETGKKVQTRVADFRPSESLVSKQRFADKLNVGIADPTFEKVFRRIEPQRFEDEASA